MTDTRSTVITLAALGSLVAIIVANACTPAAAQYTAPVVAASPAACALLPPASAEREVCDASVRLAQAIDRLNREAAAASAAPPIAAEPAPSALPVADAAPAASD